MGSIDGPSTQVTIFGRTSWRATDEVFALARGRFVPPEVADSRCAHRDDGRRRRHRLLRGPVGLYALFPGTLAGYHVPTPVSEGAHRASASFTRPWALPLVVGLGALLGGMIVFRFAPGRRRVTVPTPPSRPSITTLGASVSGL